MAVRLPRSLEVNVCKQCMRYKEGKDWVNAGQKLERAVSSAVKRSVEIKNLEKPHIDLVFGEMDPKYDILVSVKVRGDFLGGEVLIEKAANVHVLFVTCKECSRRRGRYYESILQIRGEMSRAERETIAEHVTSVISSTSFISDFKDVRGGMDFYVGSVSAAKQAVNAVAEKFGGQILISSKLFGKDSHGGDMYRTNVLLRLPEFKEGDIIELNDKVAQITKVSRDRITAFELDERKITTIPVKSLKNALVLGRKKDILKATVSEVVRGRVQVIDMNSYKTLYFKADIPVKVGDEVEMFRGKKDYLLKTKRE